MRGARIRVSDKSKRTMDGIIFASMAEMNRYAELLILVMKGMISDLALQPTFALQDKFTHPVYGVQRPIIYRADFSYKEKGNRKRVIEDVKGHSTEVYKLKKKMFLRLFPEYDFREVKA
jgi:hypothetical protein